MFKKLMLDLVKMTPTYKKKMNDLQEEIASLERIGKNLEYQATVTASEPVEEFYDFWLKSDVISQLLHDTVNLTEEDLRRGLKSAYEPWIRHIEAHTKRSVIIEVHNREDKVEYDGFIEKELRIIPKIITMRTRL